MEVVVVDVKSITWWEKGDLVSFRGWRNDISPGGDAQVNFKMAGYPKNPLPSSPPPPSSPYSPKPNTHNPASTLYYHNPSQERHYKYMYLTTLMAIQCCYRYTIKYLYAFMPVKPDTH